MSTTARMILAVQIGTPHGCRPGHDGVNDFRHRGSYAFGGSFAFNHGINFRSLRPVVSTG